MKILLSLEELAQFAAGIIGLYFLPLSFSWWIWGLLFFSPDISMLGYVVNTRVGAFTYNFFHHKLTAIAIACAGLFLSIPLLTLTGLILFAHSAFDRVLGYGLKYGDDFKHTHLGWLSKKEGNQLS